MTMRTATIPTEIKVLMNHIYELQKGVRQMVLFTCDKRYGDQTIERLETPRVPGGYPTHRHPSAEPTDT